MSEAPKNLLSGLSFNPFLDFILWMRASLIMAGWLLFIGITRICMFLLMTRNKFRVILLQMTFCLEFWLLVPLRLILTPEYLLGKSKNTIYFLQVNKNWKCLHNITKMECNQSKERIFSIHFDFYQFTHSLRQNCNYLLYGFFLRVDFFY